MLELDENGKPCRACNQLTDFQSVMSSNPSSKPASKDKKIVEYEDPPDLGLLGRSSWTFLHSVAAYYPINPTEAQQTEVKQLLTAVSHFFPCKPCAKDFEKYIAKHEPKTESREDLSLWMCDAHNAVNLKKGRPAFDCRLWKQRWRDGWNDYLKSQKSQN